MIVYLRIRTFRGWSIGIHYYGILETRGTTDGVDVTKRLTAAEATEMNRRDGYSSYAEGQQSTRFKSKDELIARAVEVYKEHFPDAVVLVKGPSVYRQPHLILDGLSDEARQQLNSIHQQCEGLGWWDNEENDEEMSALCDRWDKLLAHYLEDT